MNSGHGKKDEIIIRNAILVAILTGIIAVSILALVLLHNL